MSTISEELAFIQEGEFLSELRRRYPEMVLVPASVVTEKKEERARLRAVADAARNLRDAHTAVPLSARRIPEPLEDALYDALAALDEENGDPTK